LPKHYNIFSEKKTVKRVLIVETGSVLDAGIKSLLMREPELQVEVTRANPSAFLNQVARVYPDVIVLSEAIPLDWTRNCKLLRGISPQETLRVIVARLDDNVLDIYDKQCLELACNDELVTFITRGIVNAVS